MSPLLFNIVADMLAVLVSRAKENGQIGVVPHLIVGGLSILQYADDTIIFLENDMEQAKNLNYYCVRLINYLALKLIFIKVNCFVWGC